MCTPSIYYTFSPFNISGQIQKQSSIERFSVGLKSWRDQTQVYIITAGLVLAYTVLLLAGC